jgi:hypothetical protein
MNKFKTAAFIFIMVAALVTSGHAAYSVLTTQLHTPILLALLAAIVVDTAAIWFGTHAAEQATLGDSVTKTRLVTGLVIVTSLVLNFYYGYSEGTWITGLVSCIYPMIAAVTYEFWIEHKIRKVRKALGYILPKTPSYVTGKYQDKDAVTALKKDYARKTIEDARALMEHSFDQRRRELVTVTEAMVHVPITAGTEVTGLGYKDTEWVQAEVTTGTCTQDTRYTRLQGTGTRVHKDTDQVTAKVHVPKSQVTEVTSQGTQGYRVTDTKVQEDTELDTIFNVVTKEFAEVTLPEWLSLDMDTSEVTRACVENGVTDLKTVVGYMNQINEAIQYNTIKTSFNRAKKKAEVQ